MLILFHFIIAFTASVVGAISGIGGGIIIKPVLDIFGFSGIATINFLSGCTVLSMSAIALIKNRSSEISINRKVGSLLALSGVAGGIGGKFLFNILLQNSADPGSLRFIQAAVLLVLTCGVFLFTLRKKKIKPFHFDNFIFCIITGLVLGFTGAFLGIGGGPINLLVLYLFFSMDPKSAAINSLFVIFFSQLASLLVTVFSRNIPEFSITILTLMIIGGVSGALTGAAITKKISHNSVDRLYLFVLLIIIGVSIRNMLF